MKQQGEILFQETQNVKGSLWWRIQIILSFFVTGVLIALGVTGRLQKQELFIVLLIVVLVFALIFYPLSVTRLHVKVTTEGIFYVWKPFQRKGNFIAKEAIGKFTLRKIPVLQYGVHWLPTYGWIHNVSSRRGIELYLKNGKKILLGVKNYTAMKEAMEQLTSFNETKIRR